MPAVSISASTRWTGSSMSPSSEEDSMRGQLLVERVGEVHHRAGPQDRRLDRLLVDPVGVVE